MSGWFAVKRGITAHAVFKGDMAKVGFFLWMIENAAFKDTQIDIAGRPYTVPRGSLCHSQRFMAEKAGMSVKALRTFLTSLSEHGIVSISTVEVGRARETTRTQVTLCNYDKYQAPGNNRETTGKQPGNKEEQGNNTPPSEGAAAPANPVVDLSSPTAAVWAVGKAYLARHGVRNPGANIGLWLKTATAVDLLAAIQAADRARTEDPIPYITEILKPKSRGVRTHAQIGDEKTLSDGTVKQYLGNGVGWVVCHH